ncbi:MAG: glycosyltransferase [Bacteroidetes bacterium]|nr:MAG: glycosyltransferase [Bacteroidota bacterium]
MKKVIWQTRSALVADSIRSGNLSPDANGGNAYDVHAALAIAKEFELSISDSAVMQKGESLLRYWHRMKNDSPAADLIISEPYPIVFGSRVKGVPSIGMIHHIDDTLRKSSLKHTWYFNRLKRRLQKLDLVVTVSSYWRDYLENLGCKNVKIIYNAFDPADYLVSQEQIRKFKEEYRIPEGKPLIYAGNANRQKGIYEVYDALKDRGYHLLMSGSQNQASDLPVQYLHLDRKTYICMLHACDLVITLSKMTEGWNRIAHESLLCGTPVIGSGVGGMKELLNGAGQLIVTKGSDLPDAVLEVLHRADWYVENGKRFIEQFDMHYFNNEWNNTIRGLIGE